MANIAIPAWLSCTFGALGNMCLPIYFFYPSRHADKYIHLEYMRNGKEIEHNAAFDKVLFPIRSPLPSPSEGSPHTFAVMHVARMHGLV